MVRPFGSCTIAGRRLRTRHDRSDTVAVPAALAASLLLVLLPLLQR